MPVAVGVMADSYKAPVSSFDPLSIPWHSAFWASDPGWIPPADGGAVSSWKNSGTSAANATQATGTAQPTYRAAYANLNGKPAVDFDGTTDYLDTASAAIAQPNHVFAVGWLDGSHGSFPTICDGAATSNRHCVRNMGAGGGQIYAGGATWTVTGGGATDRFAVACLVSGAATSWRMNGTVFGPSSTGTQTLALLRIGATCGGAAVNFHKGAIAFLAVSDTALTAQQITDLETWAKNYYGVPIP